jgi:hypothetical protein
MADHGVGANLGGPDPAPHRLRAVLTLSGASAETARAVVAADNRGLVVKTQAIRGDGSWQRAPAATQMPGAAPAAQSTRAGGDLGD